MCQRQNQARSNLVYLMVAFINCFDSVSFEVLFLTLFRELYIFVAFSCDSTLSPNLHIDGAL